MLKAGVDEIGVPQGRGCCRAVTTVQQRVNIGDNASGLADWGGGSPL